MQRLRRTVPLLVLGLLNVKVWENAEGSTAAVFLLAIAFAAGLCTGRRAWFSLLVLMIPVFMWARHPLWVGLFLIWPLDLLGMVLLGRALQCWMARRSL